jgi:hypothetical protein
MKIVCLGIGSEYVLGPIAREACRRGLDVLEIDMYERDWRLRAAGLFHCRFILVTSHHLYVDSWFHRKTFGASADIDGVQQFIARYRPERSYFVPHDLTSQILPEELCSMSLFDGLLMPDERFWFMNAHVPVTVVGWVKATSVAEASPRGIALLPSEVAYFLRHPRKRFLGVFGPILKMEPQVKFPQFPGVERLEALARSRGGRIIRAEVDSTTVISGAACVVTNSLSSISAEATLIGRPVLCIIDGVHPVEKQRIMAASLNGLRLASPDQVAEWVTQQLADAPTDAKPEKGSSLSQVDYDRLFDTLLGR